MMRNLLPIASTVRAALGLALVTTQPAHAYVDPGTGSLLLQVLLGGVAGLLLVLKLYWKRLTGVFSSKKKRSGAGSEEGEE
jgi:hypothetical protein